MFRILGEPPLAISVKHSFVLPDDGSHKIRNMSEWFLIFNFVSFKLLHKVDFNL